MLNRPDFGSCCPGQLLPTHHHHDKLRDKMRLHGFKSAIPHVAPPDAKVLELGGGTGVLSFFAAQSAARVYCVESNPDMVREALGFLARNPNGHKVEVVHADPRDCLPPEPVDVVICTMIHAAMLREKQVEVIESFKRRYLGWFGGPLPAFMPKVVNMAVQPVFQDYDFEGFFAPVVQFQDPESVSPGTVGLAPPYVYRTIDFGGPVTSLIAWNGTLIIEQAGTLNAVRFLTRSLLAYVPKRQRTIDWPHQDMIVPVTVPVEVNAGEQVRLTFTYRAGGSITSLQRSIKVELSRPNDTSPTPLR